MADLLVNLFGEPLDALGRRVADQPVPIRRAIAPETHLVAEWAEARFSRYWGSEIRAAMAHQPSGCFVAIENGTLLGFACVDATAKGFFGPTGVDDTARGRGIGLALLHHGLMALKHAGYAYAIIGAAGPVDFYARAAGAIALPFTTDTIYRGLLRAAADEETT